MGFDQLVKEGKVPLPNDDIFNFNMDSYLLDQLISTYKLILNLSNRFMEKCIIGALDLSFPSNWQLVSNIIGVDSDQLQQTPSMFLKKSNTKISFISFMDQDWKQRLFPISSWGSFLSAEDLKKLEDQNENEVENFINGGVYIPMSEDMKIRSIYSPMLVSNDEDKIPV